MSHSLRNHLGNNQYKDTVNEIYKMFPPDTAEKLLEMLSTPKPPEVLDIALKILRTYHTMIHTGNNPVFRQVAQSLFGKQ